MNKEELTEIVTGIVNEKIEVNRINKLLDALTYEYENAYMVLRDERNVHSMKRITLEEMIK